MEAGWGFRFYDFNTSFVRSHFRVVGSCRVRLSKVFLGSYKRDDEAKEFAARVVTLCRYTAVVGEESNRRLSFFLINSGDS